MGTNVLGVFKQGWSLHLVPGTPGSSTSLMNVRLKLSPCFFGHIRVMGQGGSREVQTTLSSNTSSSLPRLDARCGPGSASGVPNKCLERSSRHGGASLRAPEVTELLAPPAKARHGHHPQLRRVGIKMEGIPLSLPERFDLAVHSPFSHLGSSASGAAPRSPERRPKVIVEANALTHTLEFSKDIFL